MRIFAIGDLHLSLSTDKPMDIFGAAWQDHVNRLAAAWRETVQAEDWVLIPGDISWAMGLEAAMPDLLFLADLPGKKLLMRGNHDYWWSSRTKVNAVLPEGLYTLQHDSRRIDNVAVCGTRGWSCPGAPGFTAADEAIYARELIRLELSLQAADEDADKLVMLHFPPFNERNQASGFTELIERYGAKTVLYAHLHGAAHKSAFEGERNGVNYIFVAGDYLGFRPALIR